MLECILLVFLFILGTIFGSFIHAISGRIATGKSFILTRSQCEKCLKEISPVDLIPIVSYVILHGKCRNCRVKIPLQVFLTEIVVGVLFVAAYFLTFSSTLSFIFLLMVLVALVGICIADINYGVIPDYLLLVLGFFSLLYVIFQAGSVNQAGLSLGMHVLAGLTALLFFFLIFMVTRGRGMGFGDVKFSFFIGFLLSFALMLGAFYIAFLTGAVISLILIAVHKKKLKGGTIPFGPFLAIGVIATLLFEKQVYMLLKFFFNL